MSTTAVDLLTVFSKIDLKAWGRRAQIVALVAARAERLGDEDGWVELPRQDVPLLAGIPEGSAWRVLGHLVDELVLECRPGRGGQDSRYRLQPNLRRWRWVPWAVDRALVREAVSLSRPHDARGSRSRARSPEGRRAQQADPRATPGRGSRAEEMAEGLIWENRARSLGARSGNSHARNCDEDRAQVEDPRAFSDAASPMSVGVSTSPLHDEGERDEEERDDIRTINHALLRRTGRSFWRGSGPYRRVLELLDRGLDVAVAVDAIDRIHEGSGVMGALDTLELALTQQGDTSRRDLEVRHRMALTELAAVRRQIDQGYEIDPAYLDELQTVVAECDNELRARGMVDELREATELTAGR